ncbi:MAG: FAD-dependent oxidoreductase [Deltaproteobacteria bacterium]|nr:FAD-dependent oxidoreductase [Deltaproteobacteria bacterium]
MSAAEHLFRPLQVGPMRVPNRIVETTYSINSGRADGLPDAPFIEHHLRRARGGAGWIGNETWLLPTPLPPGRADEILPGTGAVRFAIYDHPEFVPRVRTFTGAVHAAGAVAVMQLTHLQSLMCPSPVTMALNADTIPHALEEEEIERILQTYAIAAERFRDAGADAIEIHCAHETLPQWFLSPATNHRNDRWGGSEENRIRFVVEAVRFARSRVSRDVAIGLRICADEHREDGYDLAAMRRMAAAICAAADIDYLSVDVGSTWGRPSYVPPVHVPVAGFATYAAAIREVVPVPVVYAGRVNDPEVAASLVASGRVDLVGMTRALLADPEMPRKLREGRAHEIRKCIACNTCIGKVVHAEVKTPLCAVNPVVGHELDWKEEPAAARKRVLVAGGGPAGLEAARVAAERGHEVILCEASGELGGMMRLAAATPGRSAFLDFPVFQEGALARLGVEVRKEKRLTAAEVATLRPDAVIVATGGVPRRSPLTGANVVDFARVLRGEAEVGDHVVILSEDDHMITPGVADYLAAQGKRVEIAHKWLMPASQVDRYTQGEVFHRLYSGGVVIHPSTRVRAFAERRVRTYNAHTGREGAIDDVDTVVVCVGAEADDALYHELEGTVPELYRIGSAFAPRSIADATQHGASVARLL